MTLRARAFTPKKAATPPRAPAGIDTTRRVAPLDAIRGIAIGLVILTHTYTQYFPSAGIVGVELFFVLSGYLITGLLLRDVETDSVSFKRFYRNRFLRLAPALVAMIAIVATAEAITDYAGHRHLIVGGLPVALFYVADFTTALNLPAFPPLAHLWTLAVEEQFYLLWPLLLVGIARGRLAVRTGVDIALGCSAVLLILTALFVHRPEPAYTVPSTWAIALLLGCALAVRKGAPRPALVGWVAVAALVLLALVPDPKTHLTTYLLMVPAVGILGCALISNAIGPTPAWFLRIRLLQWLGLISYSAYLWNGPLEFFQIRFAAELTIPVAAASYFLIERPFLRLKRHAGERRKAAPGRPHSIPRNDVVHAPLPEKR